MISERFKPWVFFLGIPLMIAIFFLEVSTFVLGSGLYVIILFIMLWFSRSRLEIAIAGVTATVFLGAGVLFAIDNVALLSHDTFVFSRILITIIIWILIYFYFQFRKSQAAESQLHEQLHVLFENSPEGIFILNKAGVITLVNPCACRLFGYSRGELLNQKIEMLIPERFTEGHEKLRNEFIQDPKNRTLESDKELVGKRRDGTEFPVNISLSYFNVNEERSVVAFVADVTERRKALERIRLQNEELENRVARRTRELTTTLNQVEEMNKNLQYEIESRKVVEKQLDKSRDLYKAIADNFPDGWIGILNEKLEYVLADGKGLKKFGYDVGKMIGRKFVESTRSPQVEHFLAESLAGKNVTFDIDCKCGICEVNAVPFMDQNGSKEILIVVRDVTTKRTAEHELIEALTKEKELGELKSRFVTLASHEFRTPLTTILSSAFLLENYTGEKLDKEKIIHTTKIKRSVNLLTEILNDFLSLGKIEEGKVKPVYVDIDFDTFLEEIIRDLEPLKRSGQTFHVHHDGGNMIRCDKQLLRNIIYNIVSNACKYTHNDDQIIIYSHMDAEKLQLQITDHGIGIPVEEQKNIFKRFYRAHNAANIQGTGLGLNIVKKYVRLLNGTIEFSSNSGSGTTFTVLLPVEEKVVTKV